MGFERAIRQLDSFAGVTEKGIILEAVTKPFGNVEAVKSVSLEIGEGEFFSLLGPSGCGRRRAFA